MKRVHASAARAACVVGAAFLFSVVMMQPFWVSETAPTFNQYVEMFALLTLATTAVATSPQREFGSLVK